MGNVVAGIQTLTLVRLGHKASCLLVVNYCRFHISQLMITLSDNQYNLLMKCVCTKERLFKFYLLAIRMM